MQQMYNCIYGEFVKAYVAVKNAILTHLDCNGNTVTANQCFGEPCTITITKPEFILFADECGANTLPKDDRHNGGEKMLCGKNQVPKEKSLITDHRYTLLPFTAANGEPVICVVIFMDKQGKVPAELHMGIDLRILPIQDKNGKIWLEPKTMNFGLRKIYPSGPVCHFQGKQISCKTYISKSGGITPDILVDILVTLDSLNVFDCTAKNAQPILILDSHKSQMNVKFLKYITKKDHKWTCCVGIPYATLF